MGAWRIGRQQYQEDEQEHIRRDTAARNHLAWLKTYRFAEPWPADIKDKLHALYKDKIDYINGYNGCMMAAYKCLETVHPGQPKYNPKDKDRSSLFERVYDTSVNDKKFNGVNLMMDTLRGDGMAGEPAVIKFDAKAKAFNPPPEAEVLKMFDHKQEGVYLFGVSVKGGNHTVILAVDNTPQPDGKPPPPRVFWLDQSTRGLTTTNDVTGKFADRLTNFGARDPYNPTRIWPLRPEQTTKANP